MDDIEHRKLVVCPNYRGISKGFCRAIKALGSESYLGGDGASSFLGSCSSTFIFN